jgi:hemerythrin
MRRIQYPGLANHIDQHQGFIEKATAFNLTAADGSLDMIGMHRYLSEWLIQHIVTSDGQYRRFLEECDSNF